MLSWPSLQRSSAAGAGGDAEDLSHGSVDAAEHAGGVPLSEPGGGERRALRLSRGSGTSKRATITSLSLQATPAAERSCKLTVSGAADLTLTVRGLGGRLVKQVRSQAGGAGTVTVSWDGTDADGRPVPRGTYQVEAVAVSANGAASRAVRTVAID